MSDPHGLLLLLPPPWSPFQPCAALPILSSYLRARGLPVHQVDLNLRFYLWLLEEGRLRDAFRRGAARLHQGGLSEAAATSLAMSVVGGPYLAEHSSRAVDCMRNSEAFYRLDRYRWAMGTLEQACVLWSAQWEGFRLSLGSMWLSEGWRLDRLKELALSPQENPFYGFLEAEVAHLVGDRSPAVVGISVLHDDQLLAALTIGGLVKRVSPRTAVVLGGPLVAGLAPVWGSEEAVAPLADILVVGPGEEALEGILRNRPRDAVPNLVAQGQWSAKLWRGSLSGGPTPDFDGLPLDEYLCPDLVYPLAVTRGCYWDLCAFCDVGSHGPVYEYRGSARVASDMERLNAKYGATLFDLAGEVVPLPSLIGLSSEVAGRDLQVTWESQARLDRPFGRPEARALYDGGCRRLMFGLESACQRVLDLMTKGTRAEHAAGILEACCREGIALTVYALIGFPGELPQEARETTRFILSLGDVVSSRGLGVSFAGFRLDRNSRVASSPESYGIEVVAEERDASMSLPYRARDGLSPEDVEALRYELATHFSDQCSAQAWPYPSSHGLLYLDKGQHSQEQATKDRRLNLREILQGRPRLRADLPVLWVGSAAFVYHGQIAAARPLGPCGSRAVSLCAGQRSGREICGELESAGFTSGEALMALAQVAAAGVVEL